MFSKFSLVQNDTRKTQNTVYLGVRHTMDDVTDSSGQSVINQVHPSDDSTEVESMHYAARVFSLTCLAIGDDDSEWKTDGCEVKYLCFRYTVG